MIADSPPPPTPTAADDAAAFRLVEGCGITEITARILLARGIASPEAVRAFLSPSLDRDWRDPESLPGMPECADAVASAVCAGARIAVFGDFDVDGLAAAAIVARGLREMGAEALPVVPHRFREGYGLTAAAVERVCGLRPDLVITVDCGISSATEVDALLSRGIQVVVTDHHEPGEGVPHGVPLCDPKTAPTAFDALAGAGVALKLVAAVGARLGAPDVWRSLTGLAALGTVADVVPLVDENRAIVADGIAALRARPPAGIAALCAIAGSDSRELSSERVGFVIGPRLNAAGRIADPAEALELLMTDDAGSAETIAAALEQYNRSRQQVEKELFEVACDQAESVWRDGMRGLVLSGEGWHEGVRGIVAARVASRYGVPTLLLCVEGDEARGSGRSVGAVDLYAAVSACAPLLTRFGGHAAAVGVTLPAERVAEFGDALRSALGALPQQDFEPRARIDADIHLGQATRQLVKELGALEPFGEGNPRPIFRSREVHMAGRKRVGQQADHLKFEAYDGMASVPAISFRCRDISSHAGRETAVDIVYTLECDTWQGRQRVQLMVSRIVAHEAAARGEAAELVEALFADADRILARGEYDGIADAESFHTKLAGVSFEGRQERVARLAPGVTLSLLREPDNEFDPFAIVVRDPDGEQVGYLNRRLAAILAPLIDDGAAWDVAVTEVTGEGKGESLGVNVALARAGAGQDPADEGACAATRERLAGLESGERDRELEAAMIGEGTLRPAQAEALAHLEAGRSCLVVMATGRGKSAIFQMHAARIALRGGDASVFVYPLRALVADQAYHLASAFASLGLHAAVVTGETSLAGRDEVFARLSDGRVDALLTTPEFLERNTGRFAESGRVRFLVVDEAHHVALARASTRPAYARLDRVLDFLGAPCVCAVTATASRQAAATIQASLGISEVVLDPSRRDNLRVVDRRGLADRLAHLGSVAARGEKLIAYVNSREQSIRIAQQLREASPRMTDRVAFYNGGVTRPVRQAVEKAFRDGDIKVVIATSAFGEGVNIPDVRHVALFHLPFNRVEFNQMCGRAGRDGKPADVHLLFGPRDGRLNEMILESGAPHVDDLRMLYAALRARDEDAGDGGFEATNAELAADVRRRRPKSRLTERGLSAGLGVLREMGLVAGDGAGAYRRLWLLPVAGRLDIASSVRYAEGLQETQEFAAFRTWALGSGADELQAAFDRPILPVG